MLKIPFPENYKELFTPIGKERKSKDVYVKFYEWILRSIYPSLDILYDNDSPSVLLKRLKVSSVSISRKNSNKIRELFKKIHKATEIQAAFVDMNIGPSNMNFDNRTEITDDFIYIDDKELFSNE